MSLAFACTYSTPSKSIMADLLQCSWVELGEKSQAFLFVVLALFRFVLIENLHGLLAALSVTMLIFVSLEVFSAVLVSFQLHSK
jgi:hypothetical protein